MTRRGLIGCATVVAALLANVPGASAYFGEVRAWQLPAAPGHSMGIRSVDVSPQGIVYAVGDDNRVYSFTREGRLLGSWDPRDLSGHPYESAWNLAADGAGNVWVSLEKRISKFSPDGSLLDEYSFDAPSALTRAADGGIWVLGDGGLSKLSTTGALVSHMGGYSAFGAGIAADTLDRVYAGIPQPAYHGPSSYVQRFDATGPGMRLPIANGRDPGELADPYSAHGVDVDPTGNVWISDAPNLRIQAFTPDGAFIVGCGSPTRSSLFQTGPRDLAVGPDGSVYVVDGYFLRQLGDVSSPSPTCAPPPPLRVTGIHARPARFRVARTPTSQRRGTRLHFLLSGPATVYIRILRRGASGRYTFEETRTLTSRAGLNVVRISGWYRPLGTPAGALTKFAPGIHVVRLVATTADGVLAGDSRANVLSARFRVIR